jgi:hypothetical protein
MMSRGLKELAVAAALALGVAAPAHAGCCVVGEVLVEPVEVGQMYVVNQGPILAGPGHYLRRESPDALPYAGGYPYVGPIYTGYPYGLQNSGGYPRGSYSPFTGYPYVEPPHGLNAPSYVKYRMSYRGARVYRRPAGPRVD